MTSCMMSQDVAVVTAARDVSAARVWIQLTVQCYVHSPCTLHQPAQAAASVTRQLWCQDKTYELGFPKI